MWSLQMESFISRAMGDVEVLPPVALPSVEELRMQYPSIGCWAPTYVASLERLNTAPARNLLHIYPRCNLHNSPTLLPELTVPADLGTASRCKVCTACSQPSEEAPDSGKMLPPLGAACDDAVHC